MSILTIVVICILVEKERERAGDVVGQNRLKDITLATKNPFEMDYERVSEMRENVNKKFEFTKQRKFQRLFLKKINQYFRCDKFPKQHLRNFCPLFTFIFKFVPRANIFLAFKFSLNENN